MPTLSTSQTLGPSHVGKRIQLIVTANDTLGTVFLPDGMTFTNGDYIRFVVESLGAGSQIMFAAADATPVNAPTRLYRVGQCGTIFYTGTQWDVEISTTLEPGPPIIKPAPLGIWDINGNVDFGIADDHNYHARSTGPNPVTVTVWDEAHWTIQGQAEYWMDNFGPSIGPMPIGGAAIFGCHSAGGGITFEPAPGVTINTPTTLKMTKLHAKATLTKVAADEWDLAGDLDLT
jgi:hypothetical protein